MHTVGSFEAKTHLSALLEEVEKGDTVLITKHGRPIAKLSPIGKTKDNAARTIAQLKTFQRDQKLTLALDWKMLRDTGRK